MVGRPNAHLAGHVPAGIDDRNAGFGMRGEMLLSSALTLGMERWSDREPNRSADGSTEYSKGLEMFKALARDKRIGKAKQHVLAGGALMAAVLTSVADVPVRAADSQNAIPRLMQEPGVAWRAYLFGGRTRPPSRADVPYDRTANEWLPPESGIGPIVADPAHPFYNNAVAADLGVSATYRVADLNNEAAGNLMPWALEALKKQNALVLANRNG
jgi:hypothetical protein